MNKDLASLPYVELVTRAEQAISNGASPAFTMKTFCNAGVNENIAKNAVMEAVRNIDTNRAALIQNQADHDRAVFKISVLWCLVGISFFGANALLTKSFTLLQFIGAIFIVKGMDVFIRYHLNKRC